MFKMFAILCVLVWPDDVMTSELQCTTHYENPPRHFATTSQCDVAAREKLDKTISIFEMAGEDFESIQVGCEKI